MRKKSSTGQRSVAIEICQSTLNICVMVAKPELGMVEVATDAIRWRKDATSLHSETARDELVTAFAMLVDDHHLAGASVRLVLHGDFCVTRAFTGTAERVRRELEQLEERSTLYLSLGHGQKALGEGVCQVDARHQHALVAVVNQRTLDVLLDVARQVDIEISLIEPSLVAVSRLLGVMGGDRDAPCLIVDVGEHEIDVGISHQGTLLLDYRPAGRERVTGIADIVAGHLGRLQRYCDRYARVSTGKLEQVVLCGVTDHVAGAAREFESLDCMNVRILDPTTIEAWDFVDSRPGSGMGAALGCCLLTNETERTSPDLLRNMTRSRPVSPARVLVRVFWPLAAVVLLAVSFQGFLALARMRFERLVAAVAPYRELEDRTGRMVREAHELREQLRHLCSIDECTRQPAWAMLTASVGQCLADKARLDAISVDAAGDVTLRGISLDENAVFDFVRALRGISDLSHVALSGTQPTEMQSIPAIQFDVSATLSEPVGDTEGVSNDNG